MSNPGQGHALTEKLGGDASVRFEDVHLGYEDREVVSGLSCFFPAGKISVILGGSGAGKTTVLRVIGGLIHPKSGRVIVAGRDVSRLSETEMYGVRKKLGMMFQGGALLNSLTIFDNLAFPLREHTSLSEAEIANDVHRQLAEVGLSNVDDLLPGQLSGGMIKRASLARAILMRPDILLCDEPFSGLDPISVKRIEALLSRINRQLQITMLVSSHHIPSTMRMADRVVLLRGGGVVTGSPAELRDSADRSIAEFFSEEGGDSFDVAEEPESSIAEPGRGKNSRWSA